MTKNWKKFIAEFFFLFFKNYNLQKDVQATKEAPQLSKENIQHCKTWNCKTWNFLSFSTFVGHYCPPGSGFRIRIRIHWPDWIRIQSGSWSETLMYTRWIRLYLHLFFCCFTLIKVFFIYFCSIFKITNMLQRYPTRIPVTVLYFVI